VLGRRGGIGHILVYFEEKDKLVVDDKIQIKTWGRGLEPLDYSDVRIYSIAPKLFENYLL